jgi:uncharacterized protein YigA (DUF484 family)
VKRLVYSGLRFVTEPAKNFSLMTPDVVADYLKAHPEFFEDYADMLAEIYIPHPHGGRAIPISERQILTLRERSKQLETKLREVIQFGEENDAIGEKVHRLAVALAGAGDLASVVSSVHYNLREDFAVPHTVLRIWGTGAAPVEAPGLASASEAAREFARNLPTPHCVAHPVDGVTQELFGDAAPQLKSFAYVPLRGTETFGLLALASEDAERFYPEMGTVYLKRIGDMVGAALLRNVDGRVA